MLGLQLMAQAGMIDDTFLKLNISLLVAHAVVLGGIGKCSVYLGLMVHVSACMAIPP